LGRIWAQNSVQLRREPHIILTHNMGIGIQRKRHVTVPQSLLAHFEWRYQSIHERAVGVTKRMQVPALNPQRIEQRI
jgi:hypothetical protein